MTPLLQAIQICDERGIDFDTEMALHLREGYVWSSPTAFIMVLPWSHKEAGDAWWATLAVGNLSEFVAIDPAPRRWLGYCRADGEARWLDYRRMRARMGNQETRVQIPPGIV